MKSTKRSTLDISPANYKFAGTWIRLLALLIDLIVLIPILVGVMFLLVIVLKIFTIKSIIINLLTFIFMAYFVICPLSEWQATLGMKILGIKIININGGKISIWKSLVRMLVMQSPYWILSVVVYLFHTTDLIGALGGVPFIFISFDKYKRGFHDIICGTYVVYNQKTSRT